MNEKSTETKLEFSVKDIGHISNHFLDRNTLIEKSGVSNTVIEKWINHGEFPDPTYKTPDGKEWFPPYLVILIRRSIENSSNPKDEFLKDAVKVLSKPGYVYRFGKVESTGMNPEDAEKMWMDFRSGLYGACLRKPDPDSILQKGDLIRQIEELLSRPEPGNTDWCSALRKSVENLDTIEAQFTDYDRSRFGGSVSRDIFITNVKNKYMEIFQD